MAPISPSTMALLAEVLNERQRQTAAGFDMDDLHQRGELPQAAAAIALAAIVRHGDELHMTPPPGFPGSGAVPWPWPETGGADDRPVREAYIVAATLLLAEVERLDRLRAQGGLEYCEGGHLVWRDEVAVDTEGVSLCPACVAGREIAYVHQPDPVSRFIRERCERETNTMVPMQALYEAYEEWRVTVMGGDPGRKITMVAFGQAVKAHVWIKQTKAFGGRFWSGLRLCEAKKERPACVGISTCGSCDPACPAMES